MASERATLCTLYRKCRGDQTTTFFLWGAELGVSPLGLQEFFVFIVGAGAMCGCMSLRCAGIASGILDLSLLRPT